MRITAIDTALYRFPSDRRISDATQEVNEMEIVAVTLHTNEGISGLGLTYTIGQGGCATKKLLDDAVVPLVLGEEASDIERIWDKMWWKLHWIGRHGLFSLAQSAVDIALWDLKAKRSQEPLFKIIGGARSKIPCYDTDGGWLNHTEEELIKNSCCRIEEGFLGVKIKVGKENPSEDVARLRAVRKAIGDDVKLMVDANLHWTPWEAIRRARLFEEFGIYWLEEPIDADDVEGHRKLARATSIPISVGESLYNRYAFSQFLIRDAASILQPDVARVGGITEWLRVANMAHSFDTVVVPHFLMELHVHLVCAVPNAILLEHFPFLDRFVEEPVRVAHGYAYPSESPGHGLRFAPQSSEKYCLELSSWAEK